MLETRQDTFCLFDIHPYPSLYIPHNSEILTNSYMTDILFHKMVFYFLIKNFPLIIPEGFFLYSKQTRVDGLAHLDPKAHEFLFRFVGPLVK